MFKTLLKKQFLELFSFLFVDRRKKSKRSTGSIILVCALYAIMFLLLMGTFYSVAEQLCEPLVSAGLAWFYFALFGMMAFLFGVLGSAFSTYNTLYVAKDNEMLFSMPIKPRMILASRLVSVYLLSLLYVFLLYMPAAVAYFKEASDLSFLKVALALLTPFFLALAAAAVSCLLGWLISLVAVGIKNKSFITVIAMLVFIGIYYYFYFQMSSIIRKIVSAPHKIAESVRSYAYPFYLMGNGASGDAIHFILFALICICAAAVVYFIIQLGFGKAVISGGSVSSAKRNAKYSSKDIRISSAPKALFKKELKRFISSPNYMLNANLGLVFMLAAAVALFIEGGKIRDLMLIEASINYDTLALIACGAVCMLSSMNITTASSVSLEGKHIWLAHSLPIEPKRALQAKLKLHLALVLPLLALLLAAVLFAFRFPVLHAALICLVSSLFVVFFALFGLALNLKWANVNWTNEVIPIKQSLPVFICSFGGILSIALIGVVFFLLSSKLGLDPLAFLAIIAALFAVLCIILYRLIVTRGAEKFALLD